MLVIVIIVLFAIYLLCISLRNLHKFKLYVVNIKKFCFKFLKYHNFIVYMYIYVLCVYGCICMFASILISLNIMVEISNMRYLTNIYFVPH
jgi:hypothetical protein